VREGRHAASYAAEMAATLRRRATFTLPATYAGCHDTMATTYIGRFRLPGLMDAATIRHLRRHCACQLMATAVIRRRAQPIGH